MKRSMTACWRSSASWTSSGGGLQGRRRTHEPVELPDPESFACAAASGSGHVPDVPPEALDKMRWHHTQGATCKRCTRRNLWATGAGKPWLLPCQPICMRAACTPQPASNSVSAWVMSCSQQPAGPPASALQCPPKAGFFILVPPNRLEPSSVGWAAATEERSAGSVCCLSACHALRQRAPKGAEKEGRSIRWCKAQFLTRPRPADRLSSPDRRSPWGPRKE